MRICTMVLMVAMWTLGMPSANAKRTDAATWDFPAVVAPPAAARAFRPAPPPRRAPGELPTYLAPRGPASVRPSVPTGGSSGYAPVRNSTGTAPTAPSTGTAGNTAPTAAQQTSGPMMENPSNTGAQGGQQSNAPGKGVTCGDASMPKCIAFSAEGGPPAPTCPQDQAMMGYTVDDGQPPSGAKHVFAYTHGFCGPTGNSGKVDATEAAWCQKVASGCGMSYPSAQWHSKPGAECLIKYIGQHTPDNAHFEIDNCSQYKPGNMQCYQDLLAAMKTANIGNRRIVIKNVNEGEAQQLKNVFNGADSKYVSNFVIVEEEFNKSGVQTAFNGTCASVAQSQNTHKYGVNENHIMMGNPAVANSGGGRSPAGIQTSSVMGRGGAR